jgi:hypothetical protein
MTRLRALRQRARHVGLARGQILCLPLPVLPAVRACRKAPRPAGFDAPTAGTFMHYVLENVTREIKQSGGFADIDLEMCRLLTEKYAKEYAETVLQSFRDKSSRFIYLFNRLKNDAVFIVMDMAEELRDSDFAPLDFELEFSDKGDIPPRLLESADTRLKIKGFVDRLDGWAYDGRLYVRVVDYKTGKKKFSLSDVRYGMNMQMLIYLFALEKNGRGRYGTEIVPAGVLYAPAREEILPRSARVRRGARRAARQVAPAQRAAARGPRRRRRDGARSRQKVPAGQIAGRRAGRRPAVRRAVRLHRQDAPEDRRQRPRREHRGAAVFQEPGRCRLLVLRL